MGNYLETIKNINKGGKNKKIENIIFIIILLVALLVALNYVLNGDKTTKTQNSNTQSSNNTSQDSNINSNSGKSQKEQTEEKLANILSQISGISDASVMITYSQDSKQTPVYNTKEQQNGDNKSTEKSVAYNENNNDKTAIIESVEMPKIEGVIIVAKGAENVEIRSIIASAVSAITDVPVYKVQVFEKN